MGIHDPIRAYNFWTKVAIRAPSDCWEWRAADDGHGYGAFGVEGNKVRKAYRVAYELTYGEIPDGNVVRHMCGNPPCVNPYHLRTGTQANNGIDRRAMGREPVGEGRSNAKLSNDEAREIYDRYHKMGQSVPDIALDFDGVSPGTIYSLVRGRSWRSINEPSSNDAIKAIFASETTFPDWEALPNLVPQGLVLSYSCRETPCREPSHAVFNIDEESYTNARLAYDAARFERAVERFWSKVEHGEPDDCWWWTASRNKAGYGILNFAGKSKLAHRVAWELQNDAKIPDGLSACHRCDQPACVNPRHIYLGTHQDNANDATERGRWNHKRGEDNAVSKLTNKDVREIVARFNNGESGRAIAADYDIGSSVVHNIMSGKTWSHLTGIQKGKTPDYTRRSRRTKLTDSEVVAIRERYRSGEDQDLLAAEYGLTATSIRNLVSGRTFPDLPNAVPLRERRILQGAKLTKADVLTIRERAQDGISQAVLAKEYGITSTHTSRIVAGRVWTLVGGPVVPASGVPVGERSGASKLTEASVVEIRGRYAAGGVTQEDLAGEFGVSISTIRNITNRKTWKHLPGEPVRTPKRVNRARRGRDHPGAKLTSPQALEIYTLANSRQLSDSEIARRYSVATSRISDIRCGNTWSHVTGHNDPPSGPLVGENHPNSKLTNAQVLAIYDEAHSGLKTQAQIALEHGVHKGTVSQIKCGSIYRSVTGHPPKVKAV